MLVAVVLLKFINSSIPVSYHMVNWKWVKNVVAKDVKLPNDAHGNSIYHFIARPICVP